MKKVLFTLGFITSLAWSLHLKYGGVQNVISDTDTDKEQCVEEEIPLPTTPPAVAIPPSKLETNPFAPEINESELANWEYIMRFDEVAQSEMKKFGIPASIKMAQGLIESRAGTSKLATKNNNHFGMKCFSTNCRKGHCTNHTDDSHKDFFRNFPNAWTSWRTHSKLLVSSIRYKPLLKHGNDYKKWAEGLQKAGYATDKRYADKLIATIEKYELYFLDQGHLIQDQVVLSKFKRT